MHVPEPFLIADPLPVGTVVLEASAGTGKTYNIAALAARFVAEGTPLSSMMIVTFSRAATAELRARVREGLEAVERALSLRAQPDDEVTQLLCRGTTQELADRHRRVAAALAEFDAATIATTHEFCHRMITELGSLAPQQGLATFVPDLSSLVRECAMDAWVEMFSDDGGRFPPIRLDEALGIAKAVVMAMPLPLAPEGEVHANAALRVEYAQRVRALARARKLERGLSTYDDMMTTLLGALEDPRLGELACRRLAERFPVVLIDEFQDTDPEQWRIIEKAFVPASTVVLIGDPKQAIYGFRGADIHSYLEAVRQNPRRSLVKNWRSDRRLVEAINELLGGAALGDDEIVVHPVAAEHEQRLQSAEERWAPPVRIRVLPSEEGDPPSIASVRARIDADLVDDIGALLASGATLVADGTERPLTRRDVAVLVRTNKAGDRVLAALSRAGIPAVFAGGRSVFGSQAAQDWLALLVALTDPTPAHVRAVALTSFHGWDFPTLATATSAELTALGATVRGWATTLREDGVAALVEQVLRRGDFVERTLSHAEGERTMTDLRHIGQALEAAEAGGIGPMALTDWLAGRISERSDEERTRRLETDGDAVRIMTVHKAKGLEFPVVYLPELGDRWLGSEDSKDPLVVHDGPDGLRVVDVASTHDREGRRRRWERYQAEQAGEHLRMAYVALTRAQCQVTTWWARSHGNTAGSELQRILFRRRDGGPHPAASYDEDDLTGLTLPTGVVLQAVGEGGTPTSQPPTAPTRTVAAAPFTRWIDPVWRRTSYSGLTAGAHAMAPLEAGLKEADEPGSDADDALVPAPGQPTEDSPPSSLATMPGGTQFGSLVHAVLEALDPTSEDLPLALARTCTEQAARIPVADLAPGDLAAGLLPVVETPLGRLADGRRLADISPADRLAELDFELPLAGEGIPPSLADLADIIEAHLPADDVLAAYPRALREPDLGEQVLSGYLTGSIDAVLRVGSEPRHLIVDYKTNRIGPLGADLLLAHYTQEAMADAMIASHYPLQALLYGVATHRFLRWRLPGYDPATHLGGVLYLFVRGMGGEASVREGGNLGVFEWSPPPALIVELSDRIGGAR